MGLAYTARNDIGMTEEFATMAEAVEWARSFWKSMNTVIHDQENNIFSEVKGTK